MKLSTRIERIQKAYPKISRFGQMYSGKLPPAGTTYKKVRLYTLFRSNHNTHMIREHLFESKKQARTAPEWHLWFSEHLLQIHAGDQKKSGAILSGLELRTGKQWAVLNIIGWAGNAKYSARTSAVNRGRNKKKSKRAPRG